MKLGDLVRPVNTLWTDIGIVVEVDNRPGNAQVWVRWSCGTIQPYVTPILEVISESR
jgi:hypothetical protein